MKKKFKKGDLVKLREGLIVGHSYGKKNNKIELLDSMIFSGYREVESAREDKTCRIHGFYYPQTIVAK